MRSGFAAFDGEPGGWAGIEWKLGIHTIVQWELETEGCIVRKLRFKAIRLGRIKSVLFLPDLKMSWLYSLCTRLNRSWSPKVGTTNLPERPFISSRWHISFPTATSLTTYSTSSSSLVGPQSRASWLDWAPARRVSITQKLTGREVNFSPYKPGVDWENSA